MDIGIIGGGVAGSYAAYLLAGQGHRVTLLERRPDREKPCGGGVTEKTLLRFAVFRDLDAPFRTIRRFSVVTPSGSAVHLGVQRPFRIYARRDLDGALRDLARGAGAEPVVEHVSSIEESKGRWVVNGAARFDFLVGAGGYGDPLARRAGMRPDRVDTAPMVGYFVPGDFGDRATVCMLGELPGYIWFFPRTDHASVGIMVPGSMMNAQWAYRLLDAFCRRFYPRVDLGRARRYGAAAPMILDRARFAGAACGQNWALIGDAAGLCDPMTGEGIHYAALSAQMLADSLKEGRPSAYAKRLDRVVWPQLERAVRLKRLFFRRRFWKVGIGLMRRSTVCADCAREFIAGDLLYSDLGKVTFRRLPVILGQALLWPLRKRTGATGLR